jgi:acid phosphatase
MKLLPVLWLCFLQGAAAQTAAPAAAPHENLNSILWVQTAAEYRAIAHQTFRSAEANLLRALKDPSWTAALEQTGEYSKQPPAVILDLDETVIDNSAFQARMAAENKSFNDPDWSAWVDEKRAGLIPGAAQFLSTAHANGVAIFYITNRTCHPERPADPTAQLVRQLNLPFEPSRLHCKASPSDPSDKSPRRRLVAGGHRVLLLIGDDLNDFLTTQKEQSTMEGRAIVVDSYSRYWGERWFMIPNPTYGSWERAVGLDVKQKRNALRR